MAAIARESGCPLRLPYVSPDYLTAPARRTVNDLGGKVKVMELMSHESTDVRYRALLAVSARRAGLARSCHGCTSLTAGRSRQVQRLMSHAWTD